MRQFMACVGVGSALAMVAPVASGQQIGGNYSIGGNYNITGPYHLLRGNPAPKPTPGPGKKPNPDDPCANAQPMAAQIRTLWNNTVNEIRSVTADHFHPNPTATLGDLHFRLDQLWRQYDMLKGCPGVTEPIGPIPDSFREMFPDHVSKANQSARAKSPSPVPMPMPARP